MDDAIDKHFKEEEQKRLKEELRSIFRLYGSPGQWERLQATIAQARAEHKKGIRRESQAKRYICKNNSCNRCGIVRFCWYILLCFIFKR